MKPITITDGDRNARENLMDRILLEAKDLLSKVTVSSRDAVRLEGDHVVVMAIPGWVGDGLNEYELEISCHAFSQASVTWSSVYPAADSLMLSSRVGPVRLAKSGAGVLGPLNAKTDYRLFAYLHDDLLGKFVTALSRAQFNALQGTTSRIDDLEVSVRVARERGESVCVIQGAWLNTEFQLDWASVGVMIESHSGLLFGPKWFDKGGKIEFRLVAEPAEEFRLLTSLASSVVLVGSAGQLIADAAGLEPETPKAEDLFAYRVTSLDRRVTAAASRDPGGVITIHVETRESELRNAIVSLKFESADGKVLVEDTIHLDLDKRDNEGIIYWGEWMLAVSLPVDASMQVTTFPRAGSPGHPQKS